MVLLMAAVRPLGASADVHLNELMAVNDSTIADEAQEYDDWFELYNSSVLPLSLLGYSVSDDLEDTLGWAFPDTTIPGESFLLVWADDDEEQGPLHTTFKLSGSGEGLYLRHAGAIVDSVSFGASGADTSYARLPDGGGDWQWTAEPTPGASNASSDLLHPAPPSGRALLALGAAQPNPFNPRTMVPVTLAEDVSRLRVVAYDVAGRAVALLHDAPAASGTLRLSWDAQGLASGIYVIRAQADRRILIRKVVLLK